MENLNELKAKLNYFFCFLKHSHTKESELDKINNKSSNFHLYSESEERLKNLIKTNFLKSFVFWNMGAAYLNYVRKNKTLGKFVLTHFIFTFSSLVSAFYFNERLLHIDYLFTKLDPNLIADFSSSSKKNKDNLGIQILQALVFDDLKDKSDK